MKHIKVSRDSLSSAKIRLDVWMKNHSVKDNHNVWFKEIGTYKTGKADSARDFNGLKNGKIIYYSSHRRILKR